MSSTRKVGQGMDACSSHHTHCMQQVQAGIAAWVLTPAMCVRIVYVCFPCCSALVAGGAAAAAGAWLLRGRGHQGGLGHGCSWTQVLHRQPTGRGTSDMRAAAGVEASSASMQLRGSCQSMEAAAHCQIYQDTGAAARRVLEQQHGPRVRQTTCTHARPAVLCHAVLCCAVLRVAPTR